MSALRRSWSRFLVEIGEADAAGKISVSESNRLQTELCGKYQRAYLVARRELVRRFGNLTGVPRISVLAWDVWRVAALTMDQTWMLCWFTIHSRNRQSLRFLAMKHMRDSVNL